MKADIDIADLRQQVEKVAKTSETLNIAGQSAMQLIYDNVPAYKWIGIYWLSGNELKLGPYVGAATDHTVIEVGKGVCGQAVADNENQLVSDVRELDNYLACSIKTRSEIVVLIKDENGKVLGQIDADGHGVNDFNKDDEEFLEFVAALMVKFNC